MQIEAQDYLNFVEQTKQLVFVDIESTGLTANYDSMLVVSFKPWGEKPYTFKINQVGNDVGLAVQAKKELEKYHCWCTFYGKGFDIPFINTRLMKWHKPTVEQRHHLDMYFSLKSKVVMKGKSLGSFGRFLHLKESKLELGPDVWAEARSNPANIKKLVERCESDVILLEDLYDETRALVREIKRG